MKTVVRIPDPLFRRAESIARHERTTITALVLEGLRNVVRSRTGQRTGRFKLRDASYGGNGINPDFTGGWDAIKAAVLKG